MKINTLVLPASIVAGCFILGSFFYFGQLNKSQSIERQQQLEDQANTLKDEQLKKCLGLARDDYDYMIGGVPLYSPLGIQLANKLKNEQDTCLAQFK